MEDLLQRQIRESCHLALPNGLQDLMADISREVLRAQPQDVYQFIADYLSALLVARENLSVAARVCDDICNAECWPELEDELRSIGLSEEDVEKTGKVIMEFIEGGQVVEERNLLLRLVKKTEIEEDQFPAVLKAVRRAYVAHKLNEEGPYHSSSDSDLDETSRAARHTLKLYRRTARPEEDYTRAAEKIQAAYRAYRVRRKRREEAHDYTEKSIRFNAQAELLIPDSSGPKHLERCSSIASTVSLAGSFIALPPFTPYSNTYSDIVELEQDVEVEVGEGRTIIDYSENANEKIKEPRKASVHYVSRDSLQEDDEAEKIASEEIWEKVIGNDEVREEINDKVREEIIVEEITERDKGVFHDTTYEATENAGGIEVVSDEDEEVIEKVVRILKRDEISHADEADFMIESKDDDEIDDDDNSRDLYSNKEFDYESSKESYDD